MAQLGPLRSALEAACRTLVWEKRHMEDCLQSAVVEAFAGFDRFEEGTNFRAWIFQYLWNTVANYNRRWDRTRRTEGTALPPDLAWEPDCADSGIDYESLLSDPDQLFDRIDDRLKRALLALPAPERAVLTLRAVGGLAYKDLARILDMPIGSVMGYLYRARHRLREELAGYAMETRMRTPPLAQIAGGRSR